MNLITEKAGNNASDIGLIASNLFTNSGFWSAIVASIFIICLGILISKVKYVKNNFESFKSNLNMLVILLAIPGLVLSVYMTDLKLSDLKNLSVVLAISCTYTILFNILAFVVAKWYPQLISKKWLIQKYKVLFKKEIAELNINQEENPFDNTMIWNKLTSEHRLLILIQWLIVLNSSLTFFGLPMVQAIYGQSGSQVVLIFQILPVIGTYSIGSVAFSRVSFGKENFKQSLKQTFLNPMMISMILGIILWLTQLIPGASDFTGPWWEKNTSNIGKHGWFNFSVTFPPIYKIVSFLGGLVSPIVWIVTGMNISKLEIKSILQNRKIWLILIIKYFVVPVSGLLILIGLNFANVFKGDSFNLGGSSSETLVPAYVAIPSIIMILLVTPTTPVFTAYAVRYKTHEDLVSSTVGITALFSAFMMPIWFIISYLIFYAI